MRLAKQFNDAIQRQLNIFAAWMPISNDYILGDYGIIDDGVFAKLGNISEFSADFTTGEGREAKIDYTSEGTRVVNTAAGVEVDVIPEGAINAKVSYDFENEKSLMIKSPSINVKTISNVQQVAEKLMAHPKWQQRYKVVHQTYFAKDVAIMSTISAGTKVTFTGDVKALQQLNIGNVNVGYQSNQKLGLDLQGKEGVIGLGLFQIKSGLFGLGKQKVEILADDATNEPLEIDYLKPEEVESDL